ncbi:heavy metal-associated isoprenylated plant protein 5-like [Phalaenopsis equestris]|uniref:heavy metal-associated isoprenylated plant protein 5-like n=1 Tax=Phalaenopsis equestris TaxID=78828 RepID=UPI0009E1A43D|nr:heavy metal-associated isoprenylated plant protein 5-like [Phalaenopsis equestris]
MRRRASPASAAPAGGGGFRWFGWKRPAAAAAATDELNDQGAVTVVLKTRLDCYGCIKRVEKILLKVKGVKEIYADAESELVTVKGTVDVNSLRVHLKRKLKRSVEIVSLKIDDGDNNDRMNNVKDAKTEDDNGGDGDGEWMEKEGGGGGEILKVERVARRQRMKEKLGDGGRESGYSNRKNS